MQAGAVLAPFHDQADALRGWVAGDMSAVVPEIGPQHYPHKPEEAVKGKEWGKQAYARFVRDFPEGIPNLIQEKLTVLVDSVSFAAPLIDFEGLGVLETAANTGYLKMVMGPEPRGCAAKQSLDMALWDMLISGIGPIWVTMSGPTFKPVVRWPDLRDCFWDPFKPIPSHRFRAVRVKMPLYVWVDEYSERPFKDILEKCHDAKSREAMLQRDMALLFYYDVDSVEGTYAVVRMDKLGETDKAKLEQAFLDHDVNPYWDATDGYRRARLPISLQYLHQFPGTWFPFSRVALMMPYQISTVMMKKVMQESLMRGKGYWERVQGRLDDDMYEQWLAGETGGVVTVKESGALKWVDGGKVPVEALKIYQMDEEGLDRNSAVSPFKNGGRVEGIEFAAEVQEIGAQAEMGTMKIAQAHALQYAEVAGLLLTMGALYDERPMVLRMPYEGEEEVLTFGPDNPIGAILRPDASPIISEDSMRFASRSTRRAQAAENMQVAAQVQPVAPGAVGEYFRDFVDATGKKTAQKMFEQPETAMTQGAVQELAAAMDTQ